MSEQFKQLAARSGFSKVLGNEASQFILFDKDTDGRSGRRLYINGALASKFTGMSPTAADTVFAKIKQLKATAGGIGSYSNLNNAMEHMTVVGSVGVRYKVFQSTGQQGYKAGVYITDLDLSDFGGEGEPGVYKVEKRSNHWEPAKRPGATISTNLAAINGLSEGIRDAANALPDMLEKSYRDPTLSSIGYSLCFNPPSLYKLGAYWKSPSQKRVNSRVVAASLKDALIDAQSRKHKVRWVVHGDGIHVLQDALEMVQGRDLSCHTMIFLAPRKEASSILPYIKRCKIGLHEDVTKTQSDDWLSRKHQLWDGKKIEKELADMPGFEARGAVLRAEAAQDRYNTMKSVASAALAGFSVGSFFLNPAIPATAAIIGALAGGYETFQKAKSLRNSAANRSTNPDINPHMHPFKSNIDMDVHAKMHSGNTLKTFVDAARAYIKNR